MLLLVIVVAAIASLTVTSFAPLCVCQHLLWVCLCVRVWTLILPLFHPLHTRSALAYLVLAYALQLKQD